MRDDTTLRSYPRTMLVVQCDECPRISRHSKNDLIQRFGPQAKLADVLRVLCRPRHPGEPPHHPRLLDVEHSQS